LTRLLDGVDGRSGPARRFRDLVESYAADLGGFQSLSESDRGLVRLAAGLALQAEAMQSAVARGEDVNADEIIRLTSESRRALASIKRRSQPPKGPGLDHYLTGRSAA